MAHHLAHRSKRSDTMLDTIERQRLDHVDYAAVDAAAGFAGKRGDAPVDMRVEDNLLRAVQAYAKMQAKAVRKAKAKGEDARVTSLEEFLQRGKHLRQRLIDFAKKVNMGKPKVVFFKLDAKADPALAEFLKNLIQPHVLKKAFEIDKREAPAAFHSGYDVEFLGRRMEPQEPSQALLALTTAPSSQG